MRSIIDYNPRTIVTKVATCISYILVKGDHHLIR